jgi:hypothetical protein
LRRVALGIALAKNSLTDLLWLRNLASIEDRGERLGLRTLGKEGYHHMGAGAPGNAIDGESKPGDVVRTFVSETRK